ncbi:MAG: 4Fe-4S dicluster domain-containing protein [Leptospirillum sp.]|jgi:Pyruvate/2-oxoacid:ferredoxin oxidoreductase delta subunit
MYLVAHVDTAICSETACKLCTQFCPETNTILYDNDKKTAFVAVDRCKACEICVSICDTMAKHHAIKMIMITELENPFEMNKAGFNPAKWKDLPETVVLEKVAK